MNNNSSKQILLSVIGVAILVIAVVGVSFAFFSYVGDETTNTVDTGTILFGTSSQNVTLENTAFPSDGSTEFASTTVSVSGNTNYEKGIDFKVILASATDTTGRVAVPTVTVTPADGLDEDEITVSPVTVTTLADGTVLATGNIKANVELASTPVLTVKAYYDRAKYHITNVDTIGDIPASIRPSYIDADTKLITPAEWNAMPEYEMSIQVVATEGQAVRP